MKRIFITGMSGTGKSSLIENLRNRGFLAIDTDYGNWKEFSEPDGEWILNERKLSDLLDAPNQSPLFISGCCSNQSKFYGYFDQKILLSASIDTILERLSSRTSNTYGKTPQERAEIIWNSENYKVQVSELRANNKQMRCPALNFIRNPLVNRLNGHLFNTVFGI